MKTTLLCALAASWLGVGCARGSAFAAPLSLETRAQSSRVRAVRSQLAGHLERAQGCLTETRMRTPNASGLVRYAFTIRPDGRVEDVDVDAWAAEDDLLGACVRSRMVSLFFDPAPSREVRIERTFYFCPDEEDGLCRISLEGARPELIARIRDGLAERDEELEACAARSGDQAAVLAVRLELGEDGRIMAGRLERSVPEDSPLRACAVGPLLGAQVHGVRPGERLELRYVYRLGARGDERTATR